MNANSLKRLLVAQIVSIVLCGISLADPGKVILLLGTSTAGKTTIIEELLTRHPEITEYGVDTGLRANIEDRIKANAPKDYETIAKYVHPGKVVEVIWNEKIWINKGLSEEQHKELQTAIQKTAPFAEIFLKYWVDISNQIMDRFIPMAQSGKIILTDMVDLPSFESFKAKIGDVPVSVFLAYCPLEDLSHRILKRNQEAEESGKVANKRIGFPLLQFSRLYKRRTSEQEPLLGHLKRSHVDEAFQNHYPDDPSKKLEFLEAMGLSSSEVDEIELTARFDLKGIPIIHTEMPTHELVDQIERASSLRNK